MRILIAVSLVPFSFPGANADDWPTFGGDLGGSQFSPLAQINRDNVGQLEPAWTHRSGDFIENGTSLQVTPLHANGLLYYCTPLNRVFALDPVSGEEVWVFDPHTTSVDGQPMIEEERAPGTCRGVAYWGGQALASRGEPELDEALENPAENPPAGLSRPGEPSDTGLFQDGSDGSSQLCQRRVFKADRFGYIYAIDADTGDACVDFGASEGHPGYVSHHDYEGYGEGHRGMSSPPLVIGDLVVAGSGSNDGLTNAADGIVRAFDVRTGEVRWEFNPIPEPLRNKTGAANVWSTMSGDAENGLVFVPTTSPSTDYYGGGRLFDIPLSDAVVALNAVNGEVAWSFQTVRHDLFDYDLPGHALLVTIQKDGRPREVAIQQTKMGYLYVFDRVTGEPVFPIEDMPVPASLVEGESAAPTQPTSPGIDPFARQLLDRDSMFGVTPLDRRWCQNQFDELVYEGLFTPPSPQGSLLFPSALGGGNWGGAAFHQARNLLIIKAENLATRLRMVTKEPGDDDKPPADYLTRPLKGTPYGTAGEVFMSPLGIPCTPPPWGTLSAIDMGTGKLMWQVPLGQVKRFGITVPESFGWGSPNIGGPIVTAGDVILVGSTLDEKIRALDIETGDELWQAKLGMSATAMPMTYLGDDGRQYVVIAAGGTVRAETGSSDMIAAFALPSP